MKFEESINRINMIINEIQSGDLQLDESLKLYQEGTDLINDCLKQIDNAESKISIINSDGTAEAFINES